MTQSTHYTQSLDHLAAVENYATTLRDIYRDPNHDRRVVADLQQAIGRGIKLAETHALLHIATQLATIAAPDRVNA